MEGQVRITEHLNVFTEPLGGFPWGAEGTNLINMLERQVASLTDTVRKNEETFSTILKILNMAPKLLVYEKDVFLQQWALQSISNTLLKRRGTISSSGKWASVQNSSINNLSSPSTERPESSTTTISPNSADKRIKKLSVPGWLFTPLIIPCESDCPKCIGADSSIETSDQSGEISLTSAPVSTGPTISTNRDAEIKSECVDRPDTNEFESQNDENVYPSRYITLKGMMSPSNKDDSEVSKIYHQVKGSTLEVSGKIMNDTDRNQHSFQIEQKNEEMNNALDSSPRVNPESDASFLPTMILTNLQSTVEKTQSTEQKKRIRRWTRMPIPNHIEVTSGTPAMFKCTVCEKSFKTKAHAKYHAFCSNEKEKPFLCGECGQGFVAKSHFQYHLRTHSGERPYHCSKCPKRFNQQSKLSRHLRSVHVPAREQAFACECGRTFAHPDYLKNHKKIHNIIPGDGKGAFPCKVCRKSCKTKTTLKHHIAVFHSAERPYICEICGKSFAVLSNFGVHLKSHSGDRPFLCEKCPRTFSNGKDLRRHQTIHSSERPFGCWICGISFRRNDNLNRHIRSHAQKVAKIFPLEEAFAKEISVDVGFKTNSAVASDS